MVHGWVALVNVLMHLLVTLFQPLMTISLLLAPELTMAMKFRHHMDLQWAIIVPHWFYYTPIIRVVRRRQGFMLDQSKNCALLAVHLVLQSNGIWHADISVSKMFYLITLSSSPLNASVRIQKEMAVVGNWLEGMAIFHNMI